MQHVHHTDFTILDESDEFIVVDKPAPLQIHPGSLHGAPTLWHGLKALLAYELANGGQVSIINRLDRETSGTVLVAKTQAAARRYGIAMQEHQIHKTYQAIVHGWPDWQSLELDAPILRQGEVAPSAIWVRQTVHPAGAPCRTCFRVLRRVQHPLAGPLALVEARPVTGRMHQIRVHLSHLGHPILGDKIYGLDERCYLEFIQTGWTPALQARLHFSRQALHSQKLEVNCPGLVHQWSSALPPEMLAWLTP
ncbi:MAG: RluA family pseudouridine synthase [Prosthecobacter sp.]|nr:RluA family pseudouridine synthase [Prosthecobacter sp.]